MERAVLLGVAAVLAVALIGGFAIVGGPGTAQMEKRDRERMADLRNISRFVECGDMADAPDTLPVTNACGGTQPTGGWRDPSSGAAYDYARLSATRYRICANVEAPDLVAHAITHDRWMRLEGDQLCLTSTLPADK